MVLMMRYYFLFALILFITSCKFNTESNWNIKTIKLGDSASYVGQLQLRLPKEYDTLITWINYSDNRCDDH